MMSLPTLPGASSSNVSSIRVKKDTKACCTRPNITLGPATVLNAASAESLYHYTSCANCETLIDVLVTHKLSASESPKTSASLSSQPLPITSATNKTPTFADHINDASTVKKSAPSILRNPGFSQKIQNRPGPIDTLQQRQRPAPTTSEPQHRFAPYPNLQHLHRRHTLPCLVQALPPGLIRASHRASAQAPRYSDAGLPSAIAPRSQPAIAASSISDSQLQAQPVLSNPIFQHQLPSPHPPLRPPPPFHLQQSVIRHPQSCNFLPPLPQFYHPQIQLQPQNQPHLMPYIQCPSSYQVVGPGKHHCLLQQQDQLQEDEEGEEPGNPYSHTHFLNRLSTQRDKRFKSSK